MGGNRRASCTDKYRTTKGKFHCLKRIQVNIKLYQQLNSNQIRVLRVSRHLFSLSLKQELLGKKF